VKKRLTTLDIAAITGELKECIVGAIIDKVYRIDNNIYLRLRGGSEKYFIVASTHRLSTTNYIPENLQSITSLKSLIERHKVEDVYNPGFERIIMIEFHDNSKLIIELLEPFNLIYINSKDLIEWILKVYESKDRTLKIGLKYKFPPKTFIDPELCTYEDFEKTILSGDESIGRALARNFGLGTEVALELCCRAGLDFKMKANELSSRQIDILFKELKDIIAKVRNLHLEPTIYLSNGRPITVTPIHFYSIISNERRIFEKFNQAVDEYFHELEVEEYTKSIVETKLQEIHKLRRSIEDVENKIKDFEEKISNLKRKAEFLLMNKYHVEEILEEAKKYWTMYRSGSVNLIKDLHSGEVFVEDFDPSSKTLIINIHSVKIPIKLDVKLGQVINEVYSKVKDLERKREKALKSLEELRNRVTNLEKLVSDERLRSIEQIRKIVYGIHEWFERFKWFITSNNFPIIAGKDASQNELIVKKYLRSWDYFFHADIPGGAVVIMRLNKDKKPDIIDVKEAAQYAASNSKAWMLGLTSIDVYYVNGEQVSKEAPAGEYLGKGSFMIYGRKNWVRGVMLELGIGLRIDEVKKDHEVYQIYRLISAPPNIISKLSNAYVILIPGNLNKSEIAKEIRRFFEETLDKKILKYVPIDEIINILPGPSKIKSTGMGNPVDWEVIRSAFSI